MKKGLAALLCLVWALCAGGCSLQEVSDSRTTAATAATTAATTSAEGHDGALQGLAYYAAYRDFLLRLPAEDPVTDFPVRGYYLVDMNGDQTPELAVWYHSGGSMGGWYAYYGFDGTSIVAIKNIDGENLRTGDGAALLAGNGAAYLSKEMGALGGNDRLRYGHVRQITEVDGMPAVTNAIQLEVDSFAVTEEQEQRSAGYAGEDAFLADTALDGCLITERYKDGAWREISSKEYLELKKTMLPDGHAYQNLLETDAVCRVTGRTISADEIAVLFTAWLAA